MTESSQLTLAVRTALDGTDMLDAATDVKKAVCDELSRVDPSATIRRTDYFNHSYVPDVVAEWSDRSTREVFLRFVNPPSLADDVARIGSSGPMLVDLSSATDGAPSADRDEAIAVGVSNSPQVLVTDTEATEHIRPADARNMVERLVVSNVLRVGHGQLTESFAESAVEASRKGFEGATELDAAAVFETLAVAARLLGDDVERRVEKSLQLLWWAGGGEPGEFPATHLDDMQLNPADAQDFLRMIFDGDPIEDDRFWERLAQRLDFDTLVSAGDVSPSANLNRLMSEVVDRLELSHAAVDLHARPLEPVLAWSINNRFVQLDGPEWVCRFTPLGTRFPPRHGHGEAISLAAAHVRSDGFIVDETEIEEPARRVSYTRTAAAPANYAGATLATLTQGAPSDARIRRLVVRQSSRRLTADFERMMLSSDPDSPLVQMAYVAVRLLTSLDDDDRSELESFLAM